MTNKEKKHLQKVSRLLAKILRHAPEELGLVLCDKGWIDTTVLLSALDRYGLPITIDQLETIVAMNDKSRFTLSPDRNQIRAAQGHSVSVDLGIAPSIPPDTLFHGTAVQHVDAIMRDGLIPGRRQQVHLSFDRKTATNVGQRHGKPVILNVAAAAMAGTNHQFYQADNGVWLTDHVPPQFLTIADNKD